MTSETPDNILRLRSAGPIDVNTFQGAPAGLWRAWNRNWEATPPASGQAEFRTSEPVVAGGLATITLLYTVGGPGMKAEGRLIVGPEEFPEPTEWFFQCSDPGKPNFVSARIARVGTPLITRCLRDSSGLCLIVIEPKTRLAGLTVIEITLGDRAHGSPGWRVPRRTTDRLGFVFAEDLMGMSRFSRLTDRPGPAVKSGPSVRLSAALQGPNAFGECNVYMASQDEFGNPAPLRRSAVSVRDEFFSTVTPTIEPTASGTLRISKLDIRSGSFARIRIAGLGHKLDVPTPPADFLKGQQIVFGDLGGHLTTCDGYGLPRGKALTDYFDWAQNVEGLDFCALTPSVIEDDPTCPLPTERWQELIAVADQFNKKDSFATLLGYKWTQLPRYGAHTVYFPGSEGKLLQPYHPDSNTLEKLCAQLKPAGAILVPGRTRACIDWKTGAYRQFPQMFPIAEIVSRHGTNETGESAALTAGLKGDNLRNALMAGLRLGFAGASDTPWGRPNYDLDMSNGEVMHPGLTAVMVTSLDRGSVFEALVNRRTYATTGQRVFLDFRLNGQLMGEVVRSRFLERHITLSAWAPERLTHIEIIKNGAMIFSHSCRGAYETIEFRDYIVSEPVDWYYVRVILGSGGAAWTSPIWVVQEH